MELVNQAAISIWDKINELFVSTAVTLASPCLSRLSSLRSSGVTSPALANDAAQRGDEGAGHTLFARVGDDYVTGNPPDFPGISQLMEPKLEVFLRTAAKRSGV